ncbi:MAG: hypothetical protein ABI164_11080 [Acidobacteriaceae bacterium]
MMKRLALLLLLGLNVGALAQAIAIEGKAMDLSKHPVGFLSGNPGPTSTQVLASPQRFVFSKLELATGNPGGWSSCATIPCAGGVADGIGTVTLGVASPLGADSMQFTATGASSNFLGYRHLGISIPATGGTSTTGTLTIAVPTPMTTDTRQIRGNLAITAKATDNGYAVTAIKIYKDGNPKAVYSTSSASANYTETTIYGDHRYVVKAFNSHRDVTQVTVPVGFGPDYDKIKGFDYKITTYVPRTADGKLHGQEFDPGLFTGTMRLKMSVQCSTLAPHKTWRLWNTTTDRWVDAPVPVACTMLDTANLGTSHTIEIKGTVNPITPSGTYMDLIVDGSPIYSNLNVSYGGATDTTAKNVSIETQLNLKPSAASITAYYKNISLTLMY